MTPLIIGSEWVLSGRAARDPEEPLCARFRAQTSVVHTINLNCHISFANTGNGRHIEMGAYKFGYVDGRRHDISLRAWDCVS